MSLSSAPSGSSEQSRSGSDAESAAPRTSRRIISRLLDRYPELPPPLKGPLARVAFWFVVGVAAVWVIFFTSYLWAVHDAYQTHAEDMATMTQALWNTTHGAFLHQTVCNIVSDTNCLGDVSRFAIHFEPIMIPLALLYALFPTAKLLQLVQALVVATGALPAFWLASRRTRSALVGVAFALLYLLYPSLQSAVIYDFHAVTLSAAFLMFALYFMLSRNDLGLLIACLLAMATKEEVPVDVLLIGLSIVVFQRRWKTGGALSALALVWLVGELLIMRAVSPIGHSPTASRFGALGSSPTQVALTLLTHPLSVLRQYVLSNDGIYYIRTLLSPLGYLPALSPWAVIIAGPALAINLLSSDPSMRAGIYHYNAEIAPVLVFAAIETVVWVSAVAGWLVRWASQRPAVVTLVQRTGPRAELLLTWPWSRVVALGLTLLAFVFGAYEQQQRGYTPLTAGFTWPTVSAHTQLANRFVAMIPPDASVSGSSDVLPHLSNRRYLYLFPYGMTQADYVLVDVTGNVYPQTDRGAYADQVKGLLANPGYHVIAADDGYLLLERGAGPKLAPSDAYGLPPSFYSFTQVTSGQPQQRAIPTDIRYGPSLRLVGYSISPSPILRLNNPYLRVMTYWQVTTPLAPSDYHIELLLTSASGSQIVTTDFATTEWRPMSTWMPGVTYAIDSGPIFVTSALGDSAQVGARVLSGPPDDSLGDPQPAQATAASAQAGIPFVTDQGTMGVFARETITK
ncbi:MAG TPA: DUF2079 domain-containing protein [Ktedonobacterales bacterium]